MLHLCAIRIKAIVLHAVREFDTPFPQSFQHNC
jgi:hypothetical protein